MSKQPDPRWASLEEAAAYIGGNATKFSIRAAISRGEISGYKFGPKNLRVDLNEIDAAMRPVPTAK